jgi:hypothetical protein
MKSVKKGTVPQKPRKKGRARPADSVAALAAEIGKSLQNVAAQGLAAYTPIVDDILSSQCRDTHHIEQTLDGLLGFCYDSKALLLYKKLCRYYYDIDPAATAFHVYAYRDMWDSDHEDLP